MPVETRATSASADVGWTTEETETFARLLEAADADAAHWTAGDWLLAREPMGDGPWPRTGSRARLAAMAEVLGRPLDFLLALGQTARAWPQETRPACASWKVCSAFTVGGPTEAHRRREQLEALPRGARGRVTMPTLVAWRRETEQPAPLPPRDPDGIAGAAVPASPPASAVAAATPARATRRRRPSLPPGLPPAIAGLCDRARQLVDDADRLRRTGELPPELSVQLDTLHGAATSVSMVLWSYSSR